MVLTSGITFFCEHNGDPMPIIRDMNTGFFVSKEQKKAIKKGESTLKKSAKIIQKTGIAMPFIDYRVNPAVPFKHRRIRIERKEDSGFKTMLFQVGEEYEMFILSEFSRDTRLSGTLGRRKVFEEKELLYCPDYQNSRLVNMSSGLIVGDWGIGYSSTAIVFYVKANSFVDTELLVKQMTYSLQSGYLAITNAPCGIFRDRGLGFVFLDNLISLQEKRSRVV